MATNSDMQPQVQGIPQNGITLRGIIVFIAIFICLMICLGNTFQKVSASSSHQDTPCGQALLTAAREAGYDTEDEQITWSYDRDGECNVTFRYDKFAEGGGPDWFGGVSWVGYSVNLSIDRGSYHCSATGQETLFQNMPACLQSENEGQEVSLSWNNDGGYVFHVSIFEGGQIVDEGDVYDLADYLLQAYQNSGFDLEDGTVITDEGDLSSDCAGLTPQDLWMGGVGVKKCLLRCVGIGGDPGDLTEEELWSCIDANDGVSVPAGTEEYPMPGSGAEDPLPEDGFQTPGTEADPEQASGAERNQSTVWNSMQAEMVRNPLLPAAGAIVGTVISWLVSFLSSGVPAGSPPPARPIPQPPVPRGSTLFSMPEQGLPENPAPEGEAPDWEKWDDSAVEKPDVLRVEEQSSAGLESLQPDGEIARQKIIQMFGSNISEENLKRMDPAKIHLLDTTQYIQVYRQAFPKEFHGENVKNLEKDNFILNVGSDGFTNQQSGDIYIDRDRQQNYAAAHEMMHLAANDEYHGYIAKIARDNLVEQYQQANQPLPEEKVIDKHAQDVATLVDEATTEFFTQIITQNDEVPRNSLYLLDGRTDVIQDLVTRVGAPAVRKAYFGQGTTGIDDLQRELDRRLGKGGFKKWVDLMSHRQYGLARTLLNPNPPPVR